MITSLFKYNYISTRITREPKDLTKTGNVGTLSTYARQLLEENGIKIKNGERMPRTLVPDELCDYRTVISMSKIEHEPMIEDIWPEIFEKMNYWEIDDIGIDLPEVAFSKIRQEVGNLIDLKLHNQHNFTDTRISLPITEI